MTSVVNVFISRIKSLSQDVFFQMADCIILTMSDNNNNKEEMGVSINILLMRVLPKTCQPQLMILTSRINQDILFPAVGCVMQSLT